MYSIWGADVRFYSMPIDRAIHIGPMLLDAYQMIVMAIAVALHARRAPMLKTTRLGKSMRAMSDNTTLAMTSGIDTKTITTITWFLSGTLAGLAGAVLGITEGNLTPAAGELFLFVIFAAVIVGGVGSIYGAMAGAVLIGLATEVSAAFINPAYKLDIAFVILILTLLFRPSGLFARPGKALEPWPAVWYYVFTLVFFLFDYFILAMGLNIQYGETGILNFAYIGFVAVGAYVTGALALPNSAGSGQHYILGWGLPFPLNLLLGGLAAIGLRRVRCPDRPAPAADGLPGHGADLAVARALRHL